MAINEITELEERIRDVENILVNLNYDVNYIYGRIDELEAELYNVKRANKELADENDHLRNLLAEAEARVEELTDWN